MMQTTLLVVAVLPTALAASAPDGGLQPVSQSPQAKWGLQWFRKQWSTIGLS